MNFDTLKRLIWLVVFAMVQVLILNRVHLFGVATPLLCVYFVLQYRLGEPKWALLLWAFALGIIIDIFSNAPGVASASLTLAAALQPIFLNLFVSHDAEENLRPCIETLGIVSFTYYCLIQVFLFCLVFFTLDVFSFFNWVYWLECVVGSTVLTLLLILVIDSFRRNG